MCNLSCVAKRGISGTRGARCTSSAFELNMPDIERIQSDEVAVIGGWNDTCEHGLAVPIIEQILLINQRTHLLGEKTAIYGQQDIPGAPCTSNPGHSGPRYGFYSGSFSLSSKSRTTSISAQLSGAQLSGSLCPRPLRRSRNRPPHRRPRKTALTTLTTLARPQKRLRRPEMRPMTTLETLEILERACSCRRARVSCSKLSMRRRL